MIVVSRRRRFDQPARDVVIAHQEAILEVVEELVKGLTGYMRGLDHIHHAGLAEASLGHSGDHRIDDSLALRFGDRLARQALPAVPAGVPGPLPLALTRFVRCHVFPHRVRTAEVSACVSHTNTYVLEEAGDSEHRSRLARLNPARLTSHGFERIWGHLHGPYPTSLRAPLRACQQDAGLSTRRS